MTYLLKTGTKKGKTNDSLVEYVAQRYFDKQTVWQQRNNVLEALAKRLQFLLSIYEESGGIAPKQKKSKDLYYRSLLAHQAANVLMGSKLQPDFVDYAPLGIEHDQDLLYRTRALTRAHRILRYGGGFNLAKSHAKKDLIWGNSFIEMALRFNPDETIKGISYEWAPFFEMRNYYGERDRMRVTNYTIEDYAAEYGEEELDDVAEGGILDTQEDMGKSATEIGAKVDDGIIQAVKLFNPSRKIFAEIHGGNGKIYMNLENEQYPLLDENGEGYDPYLENRFYEDMKSEYFGWGVLDYLIDLANLDTTVTNAVTGDAVWDASAPTLITTNDDDKMRAELRKWEKNRAKGRNRVLVQKDSGLGLTGGVTQLARGARMDLLNGFDEFTVTRATRASNIDFNSLAEYAPTAEQQKMKKIEADKLNLRVLVLNAEREIDFAKKELHFLSKTKSDFNKLEIEVEDSVGKRFASPSGFVPMKKQEIGKILDGVKNISLEVAPRLEGALDDMTLLEIQEMQNDAPLIPDGTQAKLIFLEKYLAKKNPNLGIKREDFVSPTAPQAPKPQIA